MLNTNKMKIKLIAGLFTASLCIFSSQVKSQQWTTNGNDIYNTNTGNVGIGTATPTEKLDVNGSVSVIDQLGNQALFLSNGVAVLGSNVDDYIYIDQYNHNTTVAGGTSIILVTPYVGIGMANPTEKLDVAGVIKTNNQLKIETSDALLGETHNHADLRYFIGSGINIKKTYAINSSLANPAYGVKVDVAGNEDQYGVYSKTATAGSAALSSAFYGESYGTFGETSTFKGKVVHGNLATYTTANVFRGTMETASSYTGGAVYGVNIENNVPATSVNATTAAFKANYAITGTNSYGLYFTGEGMNYVSGRLGIGKQIPDANAKLDVAGNIYSSGKVMIGVASPSTALLNDYSLAVNGSAIFTKAVVKLNANWPDYVFSKNYELPTLASIEKYINENSHLPGVASAKEVEEKGVDLGDNQAVLLKKVEELTLYMIDMDKKMQQVLKENEDMKKKIEILSSK
jgi:hypothetical protein